MVAGKLPKLFKCPNPSRFLTIVAPKVQGLEAGTERFSISLIAQHHMDSEVVVWFLRLKLGDSMALITRAPGPRPCWLKVTWSVDLVSEARILNAEPLGRARVVLIDSKILLAF